VDRRQAFLTKGCPIRPLVGASHDIEVSGRPFKEQPFRESPLQREVLEKEIKSMLKVGVIRPSKSPWSSRLLVVKKPDGSWRPCVDYRRLNTMTKPNTYPLPVIDDLLAKVSEGKIFTQMDLYSGFWQIPMNPLDIEKTAFTSPLGLFEWMFMPFGLMNAPAPFQAVMENVLDTVLWKTCVVYR
jgi:putative transposase